jgi:hypothetical protein
MVGSLPVGIQTRGDNDVPYWPVQNTWTYKEVWVHPVARWIWLMADLSGPALVEGQAASILEFKDNATGQLIVVKPDLAGSRFRAMLPEGNYVISCTGEKLNRTFLPGAAYQLDLRPGHLLDFQVSHEKIGSGEIAIKVSARGKGNHTFNLRVENLKLSPITQEMRLQPGSMGNLTWHGSIDSPDRPWVAVVVPDDDLAQRKEVMGAAWNE